MTFAIKLPKESIVSVQTLVAWINAHLVPSIPINQTVLHNNYVEEIYQQFASEVDRFLSFDRYKADSFRSKLLIDLFYIVVVKNSLVNWDTWHQMCIDPSHQGLNRND
jgi:hypothetical protein